MNFFVRRLWVLGVGSLLVGSGCSKSGAPATERSAAGAATTSTTTTPATAPAKASTPDAAKPGGAQVPEAVKKVLGRWVRPDGGYILELKNPDLSGKIEATYHNPSQNLNVNVSRAIWMQSGQGLQVAVELNDANAGYSGATYLLGHDAKTDRLAGDYTQPQMQQTYQIEFIRQNAVPMR